MKNYEVKSILTTEDESGKQIKKNETILVIDAESCSDAEFRTIEHKLQFKSCECEIVSSKESKLQIINQDYDLFDSLYKVVSQGVISGEGDKLKFVNTPYLVGAESVKEACDLILTNSEEVVHVSKSRIVEILKKSE